MLEFKILEELKANTEILEVIKNYTYKVKKGAIKHILHTNLQVIEPTTLTILEYKINEISSKPFYIKENKAMIFENVQNLTIILIYGILKKWYAKKST